MKTLLALALAAAAAAAGTVRQASDVDWKASGSLPPGAEYHLVREDPGTRGVQALVRFAKGYSLPPHSHASDETIVLLKGKLVVARGGDSVTLKPGGYAVLPAGERHALSSKGGCEFLMSTAGAFDIQGLPSQKSGGQ